MIIPEDRLFFAISDNDVDTVRHLVSDKHINVNHIYYGDGPTAKWCALHICAEKGRFECAKLLLEADADPNIYDRYRQTPLFYAISKEWQNITQLLLTHNADARLWDKDGREAIHLAAKCGDVGILKLLIDATGDVNIRDADGRTPLWHAMSVSESRIKNAQLLISRGADVNAMDARYDRNPLQMAIMSLEDDLEDAVCVLLTHNANFLSHDFRGQTALMNILQRWYELSGKGRLSRKLGDALVNSFSMLLLTGLDINFCTEEAAKKHKHGGTVLHLAAKLGSHSRLVSLILQHDADIDAMDSNEMTPLHRAAMYGNTAIARMLLDAGAKIDLLTIYETNHFTDEKLFILCTAFRLALERNHIHFAVLLTDAGYAPRDDDFPLTYRAQRNLTLICDSNAYVADWLCELQTKRKGPRSLFRLCLSAVRYHVGATLAGVRGLPLPVSVKSALSMSNILKDSVTWV